MSSERQTEFPIDPLFTRRWSPRAFTGEPIEEATLLGFFEAARWAPSGYNAQPWRFLYARRETAAFASFLEALSAFNRAWAARASALAVVLSRTRWTPPGKSAAEAIRSHSFDAGAAWALLALQATSAGWHAHGIGGFDPEVLRSALAIPEDHAIEAMVAIGRRGDKSLLSEALQAREAPSQRLPLAAIVGEGRFGFAD